MYPILINKSVLCCTLKNPSRHSSHADATAAGVTDDVRQSRQSISVDDVESVGNSLRVANATDDYARLYERCWDVDCSVRPAAHELVNVLTSMRVASTASCRRTNGP